MSDLPFSLNFLSSPENPWGPPKAVPASLNFHSIPYAPFSKSDKLGKASDWFSAEQFQNQPQGKGQKNVRDPFHAYGASAASKFAAEETSDNVNSFEVVDNKPSTTTANQQQKTVLRGRGNNNNNNNNKRQGGANAPQRNAFQRPAPVKKPVSAVQTPQQQRASYWNTQNQLQIDEAAKKKKYSIEVKSNFSKVTDIELNKLTKLNLDLGANGKGETLAVKANPSLMKLYNKTFDKLSSSSNLNKKTIPLKVFSKEFPKTYVDTMNDETLMNYAKDGTADVLITDEILTTIMAAPKSNFPWNFKIVKDLKNNKLYFSNSELEPQTIVDENDKDLFLTSFLADDNTLNSHVRLANEFKGINYNLSRFVTASTNGANIQKITPDTAVNKSSDVKTSKIYKYKLYKIPQVTVGEDNKKHRKLTLAKSDDEEAEIKYINVGIRTEADLLQKPNSGDEYETVAVHALNQYKPSQLDWKSKLISNRGAIISTELRKNNNLFSKWIVSSILGDINSIKLGFVARDSFNSAEKHSVLGMFNYKPEDLARQCNLQIGNGWAIFKSIIDIVNHEAEVSKDSKDTVEFMLVRDPSQPKLNIYRVD